MIINIQPDKQKAKSLLEMARLTLERLNETDKEKYSSNTLTDYYDIIRRLMEALNSLEGIKIKGEGAHQQVIDYGCDSYGFDLQTKQFLQDLRDYRNRISYEGFNVKESYIRSNKGKIEKIINILLRLVNERINQ